MAERPSWLKVVGGTEHTAPPSNEEPDKAESKTTPEAGLHIGAQLVRQWMEINNHLPADYHSSTRPELVAEAASEVIKWTLEELSSYLSQSDIWSHPSFTRAAIEEVRSRMLDGRLLDRMAKT
ncbi:MAG: hypothetical protein JWN90_35 [Parcubacteria group bacterium]|nr:hypothetical protein [Parcubacteria group bacterium]